jgi:hypothetical protein
MKFNFEIRPRVALALVPLLALAVRHYVGF